MFVIDDICYAGELSAEIKVDKAVALGKGMMLITFSSGETRLFDSTLLEGGAFAPLKNEENLKNFEIFHGVITWMDGEIDIAPETLYDMSYEYTPMKIAVV